MQRKNKEIFLAEIAGMISRHNISQNRRMQIMLEKKIKLTEYEEVKEFVHAAEKCDFDIG